MEQGVQEAPRKLPKLHIYCWLCKEDMVKDQQKAANVVDVLCATINEGDMQFLLCTPCRNRLITTSRV
jgi:hypothetical protein